MKKGSKRVPVTLDDFLVAIPHVDGKLVGVEGLVTIYGIIGLFPESCGGDIICYKKEE